MEWESCRRIYNYIITENVKRLLRHNFAMAIQPHVNSGLINEKVFLNLRKIYSRIF